MNTKGLFVAFIIIIILSITAYFFVKPKERINCINQVNNSAIFCLIKNPDISIRADKAAIRITLERAKALKNVDDKLVLYTSLDSSSLTPNNEAEKRNIRGKDVYFINVSGKNYVNITLSGDLPHTENKIFYKGQWIKPGDYFVLIELICNSEGCKEYEIYK